MTTVGEVFIGFLFGRKDRPEKVVIAVIERGDVNWLVLDDGVVIIEKKGSVVYPDVLTGIDLYMKKSDIE